MNCEYVSRYYGVPACIGRRVTINGKPGIITEDRGNYIGVTMDSQRPGMVDNYHPTDGVIYGEMGVARKVSKGAARYKRYQEYGDWFNTFVDFCRWDASPERSWNGGRGA